MGLTGLTFINELGRRLRAVSGDMRATEFLKQRLSLAVQRGNAASILGTIPHVADTIESDDRLSF